MIILCTPSSTLFLNAPPTHTIPKQRRRPPAHVDPLAWGAQNQQNHHHHVVVLIRKSFDFFLTQHKREKERPLGHHFSMSSSLSWSLLLLSIFFIRLPNFFLKFQFRHLSSLVTKELFA